MGGMEGVVILKNICMLCSWKLTFPGEIPIFRTFLAKFSIFAFVSLKIGYFELGDDYVVTVASILGMLVLILETPSYTMVSIRCISRVSFLSSQGGGVVTTTTTHLLCLGNICYKKGLVRRGLNGSYYILGWFLSNLESFSFPYPPLSSKWSLMHK